jgi:deazaflavin-dependent oxidoreductase (nitroreductase family)
MASSRKQMRRASGATGITGLVRRLIPLTDVALHRLTRGRVSLAKMARVRILLLSTTGRRSGRIVATPLTYFEDGSGYLIVGSNWGEDRDPTWALNLLVQPNATVEIGKQRIAVTARLVKGDERVATWSRLTELWPLYATYATQAGRELPVFLLTPSETPAAER